MGKGKIATLYILAGSLLLIGCGKSSDSAAEPKQTAALSFSVKVNNQDGVLHVSPQPALPARYTAVKQSIVRRYGKISPMQWGENVPAVYTHLKTKDKVIALTFDACGGKGGSGYDRKLIDFLTRERIPATLFINARWIDANPDTFRELARNPLFEIENHGYEHRPLSVNGRSVYGIHGTRNVSEVVDEVQRNEEKIAKLTGKHPQFFRSGAAYYDDVAVRIVQDLGLRVVNFSILGDAGATYNTQQIYQALMKPQSGSIVICHMNHPEKDTASGIMKAVPVLQKKGFRFVQLSAYPLT
jgi:peptidoglycan/xylan/chitin deacetylase (PgdA/CDA1 family)